MTRRLLAASILIGACGADAAPQDGWQGGTTGASGGEAPSSSTGADGPTSTSTSGDPADDADESDAVESTGDPATTGGDTDDDPQGPYAPIHYPAGRVHSPITPFVADRLRSYATRSDAQREDVFLKAGASSTVSPNTLYCFETNDAVDLAAHAHLADALAFFQGGDASGSSPFGRDTLAAESGRSAQWVQQGSPSPLDQELAVIDPRLAVIHYGTNDMNLGATYGSAMVPYYDAMMPIVDRLLEGGTVPVLYGITRRADNPAAQLWIPAYNAVIRGMAQSRQVPFIDLFEAIDPLPEHGLSGDGIHLHSFGQGACLFTDEGLAWGYNMRNLVSLQMLDRMMAVLVDDATALDDEAPVLEGDGSLEDPFRIESFPFAHTADTSDAMTSTIDVYPPCDDADESGPELRYRLVLDEPTALRILALDQDAVDVDVHVLPADGGGESCIARANRQIEGELSAGSWDIVVDSFASGPDVFSGEFLLVVLPCEPGDEACAGALG